MQSRLKTLLRMKNLFDSVEELHASELRRTTAAVVEAQQTIAAEQRGMRVIELDGRDAMFAGDGDGRVLAEVRHEIALLRQEALDKIREEREQLSEAAKKQHAASRLKKEQMSRVFDAIAAKVEIEEGRRAQSASDDRFLARRRWTDAHERSHKRG
jgi:hypothetical protein